MDGRKELIIKVPVTSTLIYNFCRRDGRDDFWDNCDAIADFISNELIANGICTPRGPKQFPFFYCKELIKNAYDSYAAKGLLIGDEMILKVVILNEDDKVTVKVKDNGAGFNDQPKSQCFPLGAIKKQAKNVYGVHHLGYFGGKGVGLTQFCQEIRELGGQVQFKNRKAEGATVQMIFNKMPKQPSCIPSGRKP